jgi:hypothetical protein
MGVEADTKFMVFNKTLVFKNYLESNKDVEIHEVVEKASMENPIEIEQS